MQHDYDSAGMSARPGDLLGFLKMVGMPQEGTPAQKDQCASAVHGCNDEEVRAQWLMNQVDFELGFDASPWDVYKSVSTPPLLPNSSSTDKLNQEMDTGQLQNVTQQIGGL